MSARADRRIQGTLRQVAEWISARNFEAIEDFTNGVRLTAVEIREAIDQYGRTPIVPPDAAFLNLDVVQVGNCRDPTWSVRFDLWTKEEGKSDLTLECTMIDEGGSSLKVEIDNLHVL